MPQKLFHDHYCLDGHLGIGDWDFTLFEQCETHKQLKERETFWQHRLKTFYSPGLNEREEYLSQHTTYESQTINYEGILVQFYFYQLFNYQFIQVCVLIYVYIFGRFTFKILGQAVLL